jgi:hypothetical protein
MYIKLGILAPTLKVKAKINIFIALLRLHNAYLCKNIGGDCTLQLFGVCDAQLQSEVALCVWKYFD